MIYSISGSNGTNNLAAAANRLNSGSSSEGASTATTNKYEGFDVVQLSNHGKLLASQPLLLPTQANVQKLASMLSDKLGKIFLESGINSQPPIEFEADVKDLKIKVNGNKPDSEKIAELLNNNAEIKGQIFNLNAISSHAYALPKHLKFQQEYRQSSNPESVVAKYSYLFSQNKSPDSTFRFDGKDVGLFFEGKQWVSSNDIS